MTITEDVACGSLRSRKTCSMRRIAYEPQALPLDFNPLLTTSAPGNCPRIAQNPTGNSGPHFGYSALPLLPA